MRLISCKCEYGSLCTKGTVRYGTYHALAGCSTSTVLVLVQELAVWKGLLSARCEYGTVALLVLCCETGRLPGIAMGVSYGTVPYRTGVHGLAGEHYEAGTRTGTVLYCTVLFLFCFFVRFRFIQCDKVLYFCRYCTRSPTSHQSYCIVALRVRVRVLCTSIYTDVACTYQV